MSLATVRAGGRPARNLLLQPIDLDIQGVDRLDHTRDAEHLERVVLVLVDLFLRPFSDIDRRGLEAREATRRLPPW